MGTYIFGPVLSRRLGYSLGIDFTEEKYCNMDCLYCECGISTNLAKKPRLTVAPKVIIEEFKTHLAKLNKLDFITFTGTGEPGLYLGLNELYKGMLDVLKETKFKPRFALITNSTEFPRKDFFDFALKMDIVLPSIDAISPELVQKINRPANNIDWNRVLDSLLKFSTVYKGELWIESFIIDKINTAQEDLERLLSYIKQLRPHKIQLNTVDRPPAYDIKKVDNITLRKIYKFFLDNLIHDGIGVEVLSRNFKQESGFAIEYSEEALFSLISRRPVPLQELLAIFGTEELIFKSKLQNLIDNNKIKVLKLMETEFFVKE